MSLLDAHAHLSAFDSDQIDLLFKNAAVHDIGGWILAGYDSSDWAKQKSLASTYKNMRTSFGLHPWRVLELSDDDIARELEVLRTELPVAQACGETGIDAFKTQDPELLKKQSDVFLKHLEMNAALDKPLVLHVVKAHATALEILKTRSFRGIVHGYSGSWETAKNYISLGYKISFGRGLFHKGYRNLKETASHIGLSDFVLESDAYFDENGRPEDAAAILMQVARAFAEIKGLPLEKIGRAGFENAKSVFG